MKAACLRFVHSHWFAPAVVALTAWLVVLPALDPAGDYPTRLTGPGLTTDEIINAAHGVEMVDRLLAGDFEGYRTAVTELHDYPPLGRLVLGLFHEVALLLDPPAAESAPLVIACARTASATAFAVLVFLVGFWTSRWYGRVAGGVAAVALVLMPRLFGHAHLASIETLMNLVYVAALFVPAERWCGPSPPRLRSAVLAGIFFGLALLTKIQAVLIPVPLALWALAVWRQRAVLPLLIWGLTAGLVFFLGWPWLWSDPVGHLREYLGSATDRAVIQVWYLGEKFADRAVPWHYPWVLFLTTVPLGLQMLGVWGIAAGERPVWRARRESLLLAGLLFPLLLFSLPNVAVYDGARLFLVAFPLWAVFIGRGGAAALDWLRARVSTTAALALLTGFLVVQVSGIAAVAPVYLSYYNLLVGGLRGAERLGLQTTYWGDAVTRDLLHETAERVPAGSSVAFLPVLHQFQINALLSQSPELRQKEIQLIPFRDEQTEARYLLMFARREYLSESWSDGPPGAKVLAEVERQGVRLAALYDLRPNE